MRQRMVEDRAASLLMRRLAEIAQGSGGSMDAGRQVPASTGISAAPQAKRDVELHPRPAVPPVIPPRSAPERQLPARWMGPGEAVTIAGLSISSGLIYVGASLTAADGQTEPCLIDPALPVGRRTGGNLDTVYRPSYAGIGLAERRGFLAWLADKRRDPGADPGFVHIFFYGLERRLFLEAALDEAPVLIAEVERLLALYGQYPSFCRHARAFLEAAALATGRNWTPAPRSGQHMDEFPLATRVRLGRLLAGGVPLGAEAALQWVLASPETRLRTPGQRCFVELQRLWEVRFAERNQDGLKPLWAQRRFRPRYRAASGTFEADIPGFAEELPDIAMAPTQGLRDLLETCMAELDPYSRLIGRRPEARDTVEAVMLLPAPIRAMVADDVLRAAQARLDTLLGAEGMARTTARALGDALGVPRGTDGGEAQVVTRLAFILDQFGVGLEPDRRYGGPPVGLDFALVAFRAAGGAPVPSGHQGFEAARVAMEVGALAAAADGELTQTEIEGLVAEARRATRLEPALRLRLEAFVRSIATNAPLLKAAMKRASALPRDGRRAIADAAIGAVLADGTATGGELRFLERLHRTLDLPPEAVHAALHQRAAARDEPVPIAAEERPPDIALPTEPVRADLHQRAARRDMPLPAIAEKQSPEVAVSAAPRREPEPGPAGRLRIDVQRLARIQAETSSVSALLAGVFTEEEAPPPTGPAPAAPPMEHGASAYSGLDEAHGGLLAFVGRQAGRVSQDAFDAEARRLRLLPGAAMETINDWGFVHHEEAVLEEGDDEIVVPEHLRAALAPN
jgi:hypothetical protein